MGNLFIEKNSGQQKIYESLLLKSKDMKVLGNGLVSKILTELSKQPQCAMDVSRKLKQNEQKIYYHIRNLEKAGVIKKVSEEQRYGMVAKMYSTVSPVISTKIYDEGRIMENAEPLGDSDATNFFSPFIHNGKLNATVVFGDPYPHGEFETAAREGLHTFDLALLFGRMINELNFPAYILDTETEEEHLNSNLILIGNPKTNIIINKIKSDLPIYYNNDRIVSIKTDKIYESPAVGYIIKMKNPFNKSKKILILGGLRTRGMRAAVIAVTKHTEKLFDKTEDTIARIVEGSDKDGDKIIDSVKILE